MCNYQTDVDPDNNYYNDITTWCLYFTDQQFNSYISIHNDCRLSLKNVNVRSLCTSFNEIEHFLKILTVQFDMIAIS